MSGTARKVFKLPQGTRRPARSGVIPSASASQSEPEPPANTPKRTQLSGAALSEALFGDMNDEPPAMSQSLDDSFPMSSARPPRTSAAPRVARNTPKRTRLGVAPEPPPLPTRPVAAAAAKPAKSTRLGMPVASAPPPLPNTQQTAPKHPRVSQATMRNLLALKKSAPIKPPE